MIWLSLDENFQIRLPLKQRRQKQNQWAKILAFPGMRCGVQKLSTLSGVTWLSEKAPIHPKLHWSVSVKFKSHFLQFILWFSKYSLPYLPHCGQRGFAPSC